MVLPNEGQQARAERGEILRGFELFCAKDINSWMVHIYVAKDITEGRVIKAYVSTEEWGANVFTYIPPVTQDYTEAAGAVFANIKRYQIEQAQDQVAVWRLHGLRLS